MVLAEVLLLQPIEVVGHDFWCTPVFLMIHWGRRSLASADPAIGGARRLGLRGWVI